MSRLFYHVMQDNAGNLLFDVSGTMRLAGTGTLATIYGDEALTAILPNPMTNHPSYGSFKCFLGAGDYDFYMAKGGYTFETLTGVQGHGTMAQQNASAVAITGGELSNVSAQLTTASANALGIGVEPAGANHRLIIHYDRAATDGGIRIKPSADTGGGRALRFVKADDSAEIGSITTTSSATAYNTTSDSRLKKDVQPLTGALDVVQRLRPVSFLWRADGSPGRGFVADEVARVVDGVITGERDAVEEDGSIRPQQIDHSKLVVYLVGACKELAAQVEALTARLEACCGG